MEDVPLQNANRGGKQDSVGRFGSVEGRSVENVTDEKVVGVVKSGKESREDNHNGIERTYMSMALLSYMGLVAMFGPVQGSMYTVALKEIKRSLNTSTGLIGVSLSAFLWTAALGPVPAGPAADHYGRRPVLMVGLGFFLVGSFACAIAGSVWELIVFRAIQGLGYAICSVIPSSVVSDLVPRRLKGQYVGVIWLFIFLGPGIGPVLGGVMVEFLSWRACFHFLGVWSAAMLAICPLVRETKDLDSGKPVIGERVRVSKLRALTLLGSWDVFWPTLCATTTFGTL